jgi:hypothetical protein
MRVCLSTPRRFAALLRPLLLSLALLGLALPGASLARALELHAEKSSPFDLALKGKLQGVPAGETRYLRWAELRALPTRTLKVNGEFVPGEQEVTIVMLDDVLTRLPRLPEADALIATCNDGYASIYTGAFMAEYHPFVVLEINGRGPETWPPEGLTFNPGPYVISIAQQLAPAAATLLDSGHKRPWGVDTLEFVTYAERFAVFHRGALAEPSPLVAAGRELWINSCFSCHNVPQENLGGLKAQRPIQIVATHAAYNAEYFKTYVRKPTQLNPMAKMEAHPHYTDEQLGAIIEFLKVALTNP